MNLRKAHSSRASYQAAAEICSFILKLVVVLCLKVSCNNPRLLFFTIRSSIQLAKNSNLSGEGRGGGQG